MHNAAQAAPRQLTSGALPALVLLALAALGPAVADPYVIGDFETGTAPGWYAYENPEGVIEVTAAPDAAVGNEAVRVRYTTAGQWGYWDRPVDAARAGAYNAVTFWIRGDGSDMTVVPRIRTSEGESRADPVTLSETQWRKVSIRLAHFYPRRSPEGLANVDLFRLTRLGVPRTFYFDVDQVQFEELPEIELEPPRIYAPRPASGSRADDDRVVIRARWRDDGSGVDLSAAAVRVNTQDVTDQCELTERGFTLRPDPPLITGLWHIVTVQVRDRNGNRSDVLRWEFEKGDPVRCRVELDGDDCVLVDGEPHFAIGLYSVGLEDMPVVKAAGFNTIHSYRWEDTNDNDAAKAYLDAAYANGLKVFMGLNRGPVLKEQHEIAVERVNALKRHPAILSWHTIDEPDYRENSDNWMPVLYSEIKQADPDHPVSCVICQFRGCARFIDSVDILQADYYPIPPHPPTNFIGTGFLGIAHMTDKAMEAAQGQKPFWFVAQGHERRPQGCSPEDVRPPNYNDLKTSAWLPFCRGARGVAWFWYPAMKRQPQTWEALKRVVRELNDLMPLLTAKTAETRGRDDERHIYWMVKSDGERTYAVACNYEADEAEAEIPIPEGLEGIAVEVPFGREVEVSQGRLSDHFDGFETHVYLLAEP
jgi:hypothetical protein